MKIRSTEASKTNRWQGGLILAALVLSANSLFAAVTSISQLDSGCAFQFACFSDSRGEMDENTGRALGWIKAKDDFAIALGDIFDGNNTKDLAFQALWRNDSFWHNNLYPTFGNHCSIINGGSQVNWGRPYYTLTNLNTSSWAFRTPGTASITGFRTMDDHTIVNYPDRKIDYYVKRTFGAFNVHLVMTYKGDHTRFATVSANWMYNKVMGLAASKTKHDLVVVCGHEERWLTRACTTDGDFPGPMTRAQVEDVFENSDIVIGASDHQFRRMYTVDTWSLSNPALYIDSGQVYNADASDGYLEFHVFDATSPFVTAQYIDADRTDRVLHVGRANGGAISIKSGHDANSQYAMRKVIDGAITQPLDWNNFTIPTPPSGSASCHIDVPTGNVTKNLGEALAVTVSGSDSDGVERIKIFLNGVEKMSDAVAPYEFSLPLTNAGTFTLTAQVKDLLGNYTASDNSRTITVQTVAQTTTVPWVTNLTLSAAGTSITNAGLVVGTVSQEYHATVPSGKIFSQTPGGATTANIGSAVNLAVSLGPTPNVVVTFTSVAAHDGYVDESSATSNVGGTNNATLTTGSALRIGDTGAKKQRRTIVSFDTSSLPDNAVITAATLKLKCGFITNTPSALGAISVAIKNTSTGFNNSLALQNADFEAAASMSGVGTLGYPSGVGAWSIASLTTNGTSRIAKTNHTQFRLSFATGDDADTADDYLGFYSGEAAAADRPVLEVTYQ